MDAPFPFGLPLPTAVYLTIYLATLMIHIVFMNYVLAGSAYLAVAHIIGGKESEESPITAVLRDWMPFMLSAAITAGIAPLLFLQILYKEHFYTANLLLFYRWMAILPVLIAGFYLSYLLKTKMVRNWRFAGRAAVGLGTFACFGFVGWSWVENHLLSVRPDEWTEQFASGGLVYETWELAPRLTLWFVAAFPTMSLVVAWQIWMQRDDEVSPLVGTRRISAVSLAGIVTSTIAAIVYFSVMSPTARETITGPVAMPYLVLAITGGIVQAIAWVPQYLKSQLTRTWLIVATVGLVINFVGMAVVNEATRLAALDITALFEKHQRAWQVAGLPCFVVFLILNFGLMGYCIRLVQKPKVD